MQLDRKHAYAIYTIKNELLTGHYIKYDIMQHIYSMHKRLVTLYYTQQNID